jgi:hypothetical protein
VQRIHVLNEALIDGWIDGWIDLWICDVYGNHVVGFKSFIKTFLFFVRTFQIHKNYVGIV